MDGKRVSIRSVSSIRAYFCWIQTWLSDVQSDPKKISYSALCIFSFSRICVHASKQLNQDDKMKFFGHNLELQKFLQDFDACPFESWIF